MFGAMHNLPNLSSHAAPIEKVRSLIVGYAAPTQKMDIFNSRAVVGYVKHPYETCVFDLRV